jgi:hypothetical protein
LIQKIIGKQFIQTSKFSLAKDSNNHLHILNTSDDATTAVTYRLDLEQICLNLMSFKKKTDELGIPFLFVFVPP